MAEKKRTLQKHPFGQPFLRTMPSPLLWRALIINVQNNGTQGVRARYGAELSPFISIVRCPGRPVISLIFLSLLFWKTARKITKKQGFFILSRPAKSLGKKGKTLKKTRNSSERNKARNSKKARKGRSGIGHGSFSLTREQGQKCTNSLKTVTSLNKEARLLNSFSPKR